MDLQQNKFKRLSNEEGAAAVEFALLLPALTLIIVGILMFGLIFNAYLEITHAAREGVRWAALRQPATDVRDKAINAAGGITLVPADINITLGDPPGPLPGDWPQPAYQNQPVTVAVTYNISDIKSLFGAFAGFLPDSIASAATQRVE